MNKKSYKNLNNLFSMKNKNALIIGGAGYLGSEMTKTLMDLGANVIVASRNKKKGQVFINQIKKNSKSKAVFLEVDISKKNSIKNLKIKTNKIFKNGLDVLINCGWSGKKNTFESITDEDWEYDIETCLNGVFRTIKAFVPMLKKKKGNILNIGSAYGHVAPDYRIYDSSKFANPPSYGAAKAGVIQLTKYCASFLSVYKIRVNCVSPGAFPFKKTMTENPILNSDLQKALVEGIKTEAGGRTIDTLEKERDARLIKLLDLLDDKK